MRFIRKTSGDLKVGTQFTQKVLLPWAPDWDVQVTKLIPESVIERTFLNGIFKGKETVRVVALEENKTKVDYVLEYEVQGFLNRLLWPVLFERLHNYNIEMILTALKKFALGKKK